MLSTAVSPTPRPREAFRLPAAELVAMETPTPAGSWVRPGSDTPSITVGAAKGGNHTAQIDDAVLGKGNVTLNAPTKAGGAGDVLNAKGELIGFWTMNGNNGLTIHRIIAISPDGKQVATQARVFERK